MSKWKVPELPKVNVFDFVMKINEHDPITARILLRGYKQQQEEISRLESELKSAREILKYLIDPPKQKRCEHGILFDAAQFILGQEWLSQHPEPSEEKTNEK